MKKRAHILFVTLLLIMLNPVKAQTKVMDSLRVLLKNSKPDTNKVKHLNALAENLLMINSDSGLVLHKEALALSKKLNWQIGMARSYNGIASFYREKGEFPTASMHYDSSLTIWTSLEKNASPNEVNYILNCKSSTISNWAIVYYYQGDYTKAQELWLNGLEIEEKLGNKRGISKNLGNLGNVYYAQKDYLKALDHYQRSLKLDLETQNKKAIALRHGNIGNAYLVLKDYKKALEYYELALKEDTELGNKNGISRHLSNMGGVYKAQKNYEKALDCNFKALKIKEELGAKNLIATSYVNIGALYYEQKKYKEAESNLLKALSICSEIGDLPGISESNMELANVYTAIGKHKEALMAYKAYTDVKDSMFNDEKKNELTRRELNYSFEKKQTEARAEQDKKDAIAESERKKKNLVLVFVSIGLILVVVFAIFILRSLSVTRKQKQLIENQKHLIEEKHKEITDSINYAERIQRSFLATKNLLDETLKDYFVFFQPKDVVSGDFYWAGYLKNGDFALSTADSTGHGVPGAIMSILNISALEKAVEQGLTEPAKILDHTRSTIINRLKKDGSAEGGKDGMDCSLICFDLKNAILKYAAANNPIWVVRQNSLIELEFDNMPVGKHDKDNIPFKGHEFKLQTGDIVYALTDGYPDQFGGEKGKKFMTKQLKTLLVKINQRPTQQQKEILSRSFSEWKGDNEQVDDVCVIGVRI